MSNFEIREQMKRTKLFFDGKYVAAFNDCMWHPYIYPFCTPQGVCVIHEASVDHPFHNGIFFAHRCVAVREWDVIDFWVPTYSPSAVASSGRVICRERTWAESGENTIEFREHSEWQDALAVPIIEQRTVYDFRCGETVNSVRIRTTFTAQMPLVFKQTKEAFLATRIADTFCVHNGGRMVDADGGENEAGTFDKTSAWVDAQGFAGGQTAGLAVHQPAGRDPIPWFTRDYGLIGINQFRSGPELPLDVGESSTMDVTMAAHDGDETNDELQEVLAGG